MIGSTPPLVDRHHTSPPRRNTLKNCMKCFELLLLETSRINLTCPRIIRILYLLYCGIVLLWQARASARASLARAYARACVARACARACVARASLSCCGRHITCGTSHSSLHQQEMLLQLRYDTPRYTINDMRHSSLLHLRYHASCYTINRSPSCSACFSMLSSSSSC